MKKIPHFINGKSYEGRSSRYADFNPATGEVVSRSRWPPMTWRWPSAPPSLPAWAETPPLKRARILFNFQGAAGQASGQDWPSSSPANTQVFSDAKGEVTRGIEVVEFACGIPHLLKASTPTRSAAASTTGACASRWAW